ncbi:MAG TPA: ATP F0F1 synthase subunit B [Methylovirgula sp.]|jgi:F-type H+-transporting ATPase subunit b|nr:ATP F0F1 synthase subunit B [Methylovirgula sp.]
MHLDAEFWVFVSFIAFLGVLGYFKVHKQLATTLDKRAARIQKDLDEAAHLRAEAEALLASFQRKKTEAEAEAAAIIKQAETEAELIAREAHERVADFVRRRTKQAEDKITAAETAATSQVRAAAAEAATKAAEIVLKAEAKGAFGEKLITSGIADLKHLH